MIGVDKSRASKPSIFGPVGGDVGLGIVYRVGLRMTIIRLSGRDKHWVVHGR